jgi:arsenite/tail-anchored protein-transporting ATPase
MNIDPEAAAHAYRERLVGPYRGVLPDAAVRSIEEQLSGACTVEIASFNEFTRLIGDAEAIAEFDHIVLDTAPTGHTLRLLSLPAAWNDFIADNKTGNSCLGPLAGLADQRVIYDRAVAVLNDPSQTLVVLVTRTEEASLKEAARASADLRGLGIVNQQLLVNGRFRAVDAGDPVAAALERRGEQALEQMPPALAMVPRCETPFHPGGLLGLMALRTAFDEPSPFNAPCLSEYPSLPGLGELVDRLALEGRGVILTMGKGGVGKTTIAAGIAIQLARRGFPVTLSTTDPAAHIADAVDGSLENLTITRINPAVETRAHIEHVMNTTGAALDEEGRALLEEELRSPCTEEIAVFQAFARTVAEGQDRFVVLDTAPTGHTLLLLDATEAYHREVQRSRSGNTLPESVRNLLPRLRDPAFTKVLIVTLAEATPVHEAMHLRDDLDRAGIRPHAWIVNQSFAAAAPSDSALRARAAQEIPFIQEVTQQAATTENTVLIPWKDGVLAGVANLNRLLEPVRATTTH